MYILSIKFMYAEYMYTIYMCLVDQLLFLYAKETFNIRCHKKFYIMSICAIAYCFPLLCRKYVICIHTW